MTTYADRERSIADSEPIEFYDFTRVTGDVTERWGHVTSQTNLSLNGALYGALPGLLRSEIQQTGEASSMQVTITMPRNTCVAEELIGRKSPSPIRVTITRAQRGLADSEAKTIFSGEITDPVFEGSTATLTCMSEESAQSDTLGRTYYQRTCPYMLYGSLCGADPTLATWPGKVTAISADGFTVTVDEVGSPADHLGGGSHYYQSGWIQLPGAPPAFVTQQNGHDLVIQTAISGLVINDVLVMRAGCDHTPVGCVSHSNIARFGGFILIPLRDPWAGVS